MTRAGIKPVIFLIEGNAPSCEQKFLQAMKRSGQIRHLNFLESDNVISKCTSIPLNCEEIYFIYDADRCVPDTPEARKLVNNFSKNLKGFAESYPNTKLYLLQQTNSFEDEFKLGYSINAKGYEKLYRKFGVNEEADFKHKIASNISKEQLKQKLIKDEFNFDVLWRKSLLDKISENPV